MIKKLMLSALACSMLLVLPGCNSLENEPLEDIMSHLYDGIVDNDIPMLGEPTEITHENANWWLQGAEDTEFTEGLGQEPLIGSIAHSVVLLKSDNPKETADSLRENMDTNKWVCVGIEKEDLIVESRDNVVLMVIDDIGIGDKIAENFENYKPE